MMQMITFARRKYIKKFPWKTLKFLTSVFVIIPLTARLLVWQEDHIQNTIKRFLETSPIVAVTLKYLLHDTWPRIKTEKEGNGLKMHRRRFWSTRMRGN